MNTDDLNFAYKVRHALNERLDHLPASPGALARWAAEPTRHILLPASSFISNAKGYPVLSKATQTFLKEVMKVRPRHLLWPPSSRWRC